MAREFDAIYTPASSASSWWSIWKEAVHKCRPKEEWRRTLKFNLEEMSNTIVYKLLRQFT